MTAREANLDGEPGKGTIRYLIAYDNCRRPHRARQEVLDRFVRYRAAGFDVEPFELNFGGRERPCFAELDWWWRHGDRAQLRRYGELLDALDGRDVLVNLHGSHLHPEFVSSIDAYSVYCCFDDPEAIPHRSRPAAPAYDLCMVGNIAEIEKYRDWGVRAVDWWPLGFRAEDVLDGVGEESISHPSRDVPLVLLCGLTDARRERLLRLRQLFPGGAFYGTGWPDGYLPEKERVPLLRRAKIGLNIHNSTGPVNSRTFSLPANGVMQLCDNARHLDKVFRIGSEVVSFDSIEDAADKVRYYLSHDRERQEIALNGFRRAWKDYEEISLFQSFDNRVRFGLLNYAVRLRPTVRGRNLLRYHRVKTMPTIVLRKVRNVLSTYVRKPEKSRCC